MALFPLQLLPYIQGYKVAKRVAPSWRIPKALPTPHGIAGAPRQGVKAAAPNTQKQTQGGCQIKETKKHGPNERTDQNSRKRTK